MQRHGYFLGRWYSVFCFLLVWTNWTLTAVRAQSVSFPKPERITDRQGLPQAFIESIVQDTHGFIWVATRDGLCRYDGRTFRVFQPDPSGRPSLSFAGVGRLRLDYRGRIWVASERGDLDLFDPRTETFVNFSNQPAFKRLFGLHQISCLYFDHQGRLWLALSRGLGCIDTRMGKMHLYRHQAKQPNSLPGDYVRGIVEDQQGQIWLATNAGLNRFDAAKSHFVPVPVGTLRDSLNGLYVRPTGEFLVGSNHSLTLFNPQNGATRSFRLTEQSRQWNPMQFATDSRGTVYIVDNGTTYRFSDREGLRLVPELNGNSKIESAQSIWIDRSDVLWLGTTGMGIRTYDLRANSFQTAPYQSPFHKDLLVHWLGVKKGLAAEFVNNNSGYDFRYTFDRQKNLWFNARSTPFQRLDLKTGALSSVAFPETTSGPPANLWTLYLLATDPEDRIWAVHNFKAWWYNDTSARWMPFRYPLRIDQPVSIWQLVVDRNAIWLATDRAGLYRIDRHTGAHRQFTYQSADTTSLSNNNLFCLSMDPTDDNRLWIGTFGSGLCAFDKRTGKSRRLTVADGLPNNVVYSAIPDQQGYLWVGTNRGLARLHRRTFAVRTFTRDDGLLADEFNRFHYLHLPDDRILLGGIDGITAFYPRAIHDDRFQPRVEITTVQVNNQPLRLSADATIDASAPVFRSVQGLQHLTLPYNQNFLSVEFAVMQYNKSGKNRYRYRLDGIDERWVETSQPDAIYTALSPGHYVLNLNASNTSGKWSSHIRKLSITILAPLWATWWAYTIYGLTLLVVGYLAFRSYVNRLRLQQTMSLQKQTLALQEREARQLREMDEMKTRFFSNITHEFRTPLTLILTPTQQLQQKLKEDDEQRRLSTIEKNAHQLLGLLDQLMDLAKTEASSMTVEESVGNLSEFMGALMQAFQPQAEAKQIDLRYESDLTGDYWFDRSKLERIMYNLLGNALKFTHKHGRVTIRLDKLGEERVRLSVADTGIGISAEKLPYIFDRFYQAQEVSRQQAVVQHQPKGTGIGLALVRELVIVQQGSIDVESNLEAGTTFTLELPYRPVTTQTADASGGFSESVVNETSALPALENSEREPLILLVEDNDELAEFISQSLPMTYQIHRAANGVEGFERALELLPDLVLSDVLMPELDGYALCGKLKNDLHTSHIPVILLTARGELASRTIGLMQGADDYITKPFHLPELQLRIRNQLYSRRRLREWLQRSLTRPDGTDPVPAFTKSDAFMSTLYGLLDKYLDDSSFGVDELTSQIGMSRASLYRKIKAVSALPVNELIRNYRLKRATQYLRQGQSVAETAYLVGFESPSYFAKCFRDLYQLTPSEFAETR